jgi:prefoldin subunit 5
MTRYDTEALRAEAGEIEAQIEALEQKRNKLEALIEMGADDYAPAAMREGWNECFDAIGDELGPLRSRLDEIEEDLSFAEAAEDNRERQPR